MLELGEVFDQRPRYRSELCFRLHHDQAPEGLELRHLLDDCAEGVVRCEARVLDLEEGVESSDREEHDLEVDLARILSFDRLSAGQVALEEAIQKADGFLNHSLVVVAEVKGRLNTPIG